jgi:hypothetical protein
MTEKGRERSPALLMTTWHNPRRASRVGIETQAHPKRGKDIELGYGYTPSRRSIRRQSSSGSSSPRSVEPLVLRQLEQRRGQIVEQLGALVGVLRWRYRSGFLGRGIGAVEMAAGRSVHAAAEPFLISATLRMPAVTALSPQRRSADQNAMR